jgi:hypothetical protein
VGLRVQSFVFRATAIHHKREDTVVHGLWRFGFLLALCLLLLERQTDKYRRAVPSRRMRYKSKSSSSARVMSSDASAKPVEVDEAAGGAAEEDVVVVVVAGAA